MHESSKAVRQTELMNLLLLHLPLKVCAIKLQVSYQTVRKYAAEPEFLTSLRELSQSIYTEVLDDLKNDKQSLQERMLEASDKALERLKVLLDSPQEGIALKAADSILDRTMETARNRKIEGQIDNHYRFDPITLMHAAATSMELDAATQQNSKPPLPPPQMLEGDTAG